MHVDRLTRNLAIANLVAQIFIIVTGGAVRLTGSGLGCSQWPLCEPGQFTPVFHEASSIHPYIEFGNRTLTGVLTIIAVALLLAVYTRPATRDRRAVKKLAWLPLIGIAIQAVVGGITVWVDLHPAIVGSHMLISLALVAVSTYLLWRLVNPDDAPRPLLDQTRGITLAGTGIGTLLVTLGVIVTGAGPHSGDDAAPYRWAMDTVMITRVHAGLAWLFIAFVILSYVLVTRDKLASPSAQGAKAGTAWGYVLAVTFLEGIIGYTQHFLNLPEVLVGLHMFGAALIVTALTWAICHLYPRTAQVTASPSADENPIGARS